VNASSTTVVEVAARPPAMLSSDATRPADQDNGQSFSSALNRASEQAHAAGRRDDGPRRTDERRDGARDGASTAAEESAQSEAPRTEGPRAADGNGERRGQQRESKSAKTGEEVHEGKGGREVIRSRRGGSSAVRRVAAAAQGDEGTAQTPLKESGKGRAVPDVQGPQKAAGRTKNAARSEPPQQVRAGLQEGRQPEANESPGRGAVRNTDAPEAAERTSRQVPQDPGPQRHPQSTERLTEHGTPTGPEQGERTVRRVVPAGVNAATEGNDTAAVLSDATRDGKDPRVAEQESRPRNGEPRNRTGGQERFGVQAQDAARPSSGTRQDALGGKAGQQPDVPPGPEKRVSNDSTPAAQASQSWERMMMEAAQERVPAHVRTEAGRALHWTRSRIVQAAQYLQGNGRTELRLRLNPPELGRMKVEIEMREGMLEVRMRVEDPQVRDIIRNEVQNLDRALKDMDVDVSRFDVSDYRQGSERQGWGSQDERTTGSEYGGEAVELGELEKVDEDGWVRITESGGMDCLV